MDIAKQKPYFEGLERKLLARNTLNARKAKWADEMYDLLDSLLEADHGYEVFEDLLRRKMSEIPE
jgi:hypothetical protein